MLSSILLKHIAGILTEKGLAITAIETEPVNGGSINKTYKIIVNHSRHYFLKTNSLHPFPDLFEKERNGLELLSATKITATPAVISCDVTSDHQLLLLEWIPPGEKNHSFWKKFGEQLACLHHYSHSQFGLQEDNYMAVFKQHNEWHNDWSAFFIEKRLLPQIQIAAKTGHLIAKDIEAFHQLFKALDSIFGNEKPCLLHGDLWSGNFICNEKSEPVLIDPAVYFGHRSVDLGMTTLFGGFDVQFYRAYNYHFPLPDNHKEQWELANLYPLLIHLNLFGVSYLPAIRRTIKRHKLSL